MAASGSVFADEEDPELARASVPFGLKTLEGLLAQSPRHRGLLLAACSGFTQYAYAFVQQDADLAEASDLARATELKARAKRLYLRAKAYGLRGLDEAVPGFEANLRQDSEGTLARLGRDHVPLLYYTAASWAGAFALDVADSSLSVDQTLIEKLMRRALELDEGWNGGAIHEFMGSWEAGHGSVGGSLAKARQHFDRALVLSGGNRASVLVGLAESIAVNAQDRRAFDGWLRQALSLDPAKAPGQRLANVIAQRRAKWLQGRADELFVDEPKPEEKAS